MSESKKAILGAVIVFSAIGIYVVWFVPALGLTPLVWALRILMPLIAIGTGVILGQAALRKDLAPDFIRQYFGKPFERNGVCFFVEPGNRNGIGYLNIAFQNQYSMPCKFRVVVRPPAKSFSATKRVFEGIAMDVQCEGGAFGVASAPIGIPAKYQGKATMFEVAAATRYETGRGELLRFKNGLRAGKASTPGLVSAANATVEAAAVVFLLASGGVHVGSPARVMLQLPSAIAETIPDGVQPTLRTIWKLGDPESVVAEVVNPSV